MSETEKKQRAAYQKNRSRHIVGQSIIVIVLTAALLISAFSAKTLSKNTFVTYTENGTVDYQVYLNSNRFYSEDFLDDDHAYISALVNNISAVFTYSMQINEKQAEYKYTYYVDTRLEILDKDSDAVIFDPVYETVAPQTATSSERELQIKQSLTIDYNKYNKLAQDFVNTYSLKDAESSLIVALHVNVAGTCPNVPKNQGEYVVDMRIPLTQNTMKIETNTSVPVDGPKVLACNDSNATSMVILSGILAVADMVCTGLLLRYMICTRDRHINYARQVKKILSYYKSYVQQIKTPFKAENYQMLYVASFEELLEIRDTLQMPILMYENKDRTCTEFLLPTETELCYAYKICVAGAHLE